MRGRPGRGCQVYDHACLSFPSDVTVGSVMVSCEGYSNPDDPYILRGSCGLEYNLDYTRKGQQNRNQNSYSNSYSSTYNSCTALFSLPNRLFTAQTARLLEADGGRSSSGLSSSRSSSS